MNVTIIGANGFIGKHLSELLSQNEDLNLTLFSRKFSDDFPKLNSAKCRFIQGDYKKNLEMSPILKGQDLVYHLVSVSFPASSWNNPVLDIEENLIPSLNFFQACTEAKVKKVVFISSGGTVYGKQDFLLDESNLLKPFSPYGIIKSTIEYFLEYFKIKSNLQYDIYRVSNAYGPKQNKIGFGVINTWLRAAALGEKINIMGDGTAEKDYIYIEDVAKMVALSTYSDIYKSGVYNVCSGETTSLNKILEIIKLNCGDGIEINTLDAPPSDNKTVRLDNTKILRSINLERSTPIEEGIEKTWKYIQSIHQ